MTSELIDLVHKEALESIPQSISRKNLDLAPEQVAEVVSGAEALLDKQVLGEVMPPWLPPFALKQQDLYRAHTLLKIAKDCLADARDFADVVNRFRNVIEEGPVRTRLRYFWPPTPTGTRAGDPPMPSVGPGAALPPLSEDEPDHELAAMHLLRFVDIRLADAIDYFILTDPSWLPILAEVKRQDPEMYLAAVLEAYRIATRKRKGKRPSAPGVAVTTRVLTVEALRELCSVSQARAIKIWNGSFQEHAYGDEGTHSEFAKNHKSVRNYLARLLAHEKLTMTKLSPRELRALANK